MYGILELGDGAATPAPDAPPLIEEGDSDCVRELTRHDSSDSSDIANYARVGNGSARWKLLRVVDLFTCDVLMM